MKKNYDVIFLTNIPAFYKVNLFNEINKHLSVLAIFTGHSPQDREKDFLSKVKSFDSISIAGNKLRKISKLIRILMSISYKHLIIGGWDEILFWVAAFLSPKSKNGLIVESSRHESTITGIKGIIKRVFLKRIHTCFVPGDSNENLLKSLNFSGKIKVIHGVGIFNVKKQPEFIESRSPISKFLYVGRLSPEKNLKRLIQTFNDLDDKTLTIVGAGPQEHELKDISAPNIRFLGHIENDKLGEIYQSHHVFILPSISEPWGLVVDEALNNGIPILGSRLIGCADTWLKDNQYGLTFNPYDIIDMKNKINLISDNRIYNKMRKNISEIEFERHISTMVVAFVHE